MTDDRSIQVLATTPATTGWRGHRRKTVGWHEVPFDDWAIGGVALRELVATRQGGEADTPPEQRMTRLDPRAPLGAVAGLRALLGEAHPDFDDGRVALLLCPIDRDLDCGAISARIVLDADTVEWTDVGWQVTYEPFVPEPDEHGPLLHFRFERAQYEALLRGLLAAYEEKAAVPPPESSPVEVPRRRWFRRG